MRACFFETRGSASVIAHAAERPMIVPPKDRGTRMPASGPARIRSSPATSPMETAPSVDAMSMREPEWSTVSVTNADGGRTETTRPPSGSRIRRVTDSGSTAGPAPSGPAAARTAATSQTVAVASVVTRRSMSSRARPRSVSLIFISGPSRWALEGRGYVVSTRREDAGRRWRPAARRPRIRPVGRAGASPRTRADLACREHPSDQACQRRCRVFG